MSEFFTPLGKPRYNQAAKLSDLPVSFAGLLVSADGIRNVIYMLITRGLNLSIRYCAMNLEMIQYAEAKIVCR